jgi:MFS family permease
MFSAGGLWPKAGPERALTAATLISSFGFATFATASGLFFVKYVELTPQTVGFGLSVAGIAALGSPLLFGKLADAVDIRRLTMTLFFAQAALVGCYAVTRSTAMFILFATAVTFVDSGSWVARSVLVTTIVGPDDRVRFKAQQRSVFNVGAGLGALVAAVPMQLGTRTAYAVLLLVYVVCYAASGLCLAALPRPTEPRPARARGWTALRDPAYIVSAMLSGLLMMDHSLMFIAFPLWVAHSTAAPTLLVALLVSLNTVLVVTLQVRLSKGGETVTGAASAARRGALVLLPACGLLAAAAYGSALWAGVALTAGIVLMTLGELWTSTASWGLSYGLAPDHLMGEYQGVFALGQSIEGIVGPVVATSLVIGWGVPGWLVVGFGLLVLGLLITPTAKWAERTRPASMRPGTVI